MIFRHHWSISWQLRFSDHKSKVAPRLRRSTVWGKIIFFTPKMTWDHPCTNRFQYFTFLMKARNHPWAWSWTLGVFRTSTWSFESRIGLLLSKSLSRNLDSMPIAHQIFSANKAIYFGKHPTLQQFLGPTCKSFQFQVIFQRNFSYKGSSWEH